MTARTAFPSPRDPLFDEAASQVGIDEALFRPVNRFPQSAISDAFPFRVTREPFGFEYPHTVPKKDYEV